MRMWMVDPRVMCRKHLLGEHLELHMLAGSLRAGRSLSGYASAGLIQSNALHDRHNELVGEMERRGYRHRSPMTIPDEITEGRVNLAESIKELYRRCADCRQRMDLVLPNSRVI